MHLNDNICLIKSGNRNYQNPYNNIADNNQEVISLFNNISQHLNNFGLISNQFIKHNSGLLLRNLSSEEHKTFKEIKNEHRSLEYLGSRAILKHLIRLLLYHNNFEPSEISVLKDFNGLPYVSINTQPYRRLKLSITHKSGFIFCAVEDKSNVGTDIELISSRPEKVSSRFVNNFEHNLISKYITNQATRNYYYTRLWSTKEALLKYLCFPNLLMLSQNTTIIDFVNDKSIIEYIFNYRKYYIFAYNYIYKNHLITCIKD